MVGRGHSNTWQPVTTAAPDQSRKIWPLRARAFGINIDETTSPRPRHHMPGPIVATDPQALIATTRNQVPCPPRRRRCACRLPPVPASHTSDLTSAPATARPRRARPACACRAHPSYPTPAARLPAFKTPSRVRQQQPRRSVKNKNKNKNPTLRSPSRRSMQCVGTSAVYSCSYASELRSWGRAGS